MHRTKLFTPCILCPVRAVGCSSEKAVNMTFSVAVPVLGGKSCSRRIHQSEHLGLWCRSGTTTGAGAYSHSLVLNANAYLPRLVQDGRRSFSTSDDDGTDGKMKPVFVAIPNPIKIIRNKIFFWLIRSYFDPEFTIEDFTQGAKQALVTISQQLAEGALENLEGLLSPKLLREIQNTCHGFSLKEISSLSVSADDILHTFPHDIAIHYDDKGGKFLFILMKFWCHSTQSGSSDPEVKGFRFGRPPPGVSQEQFDSLGSVYSCTYEFHRNISPGANPQWMITYMQHGQLINTETRGLPDQE